MLRVAFAQRSTEAQPEFPGLPATSTTTTNTTLKRMTTIAYAQVVTTPGTRAHGTPGEGLGNQETKAGAKANSGGRGGKEGGNGRKGAEAQETLGVCQRSPQLFSGSWFPGACGGQVRACHGLFACAAPHRLTAWPHDCTGHATACQHASTINITALHAAPPRLASSHRRTH